MAASRSARLVILIGSTDLIFQGSAQLVFLVVILFSSFSSREQSFRR
jgi:hypothetical protein